MLSIFKIASKIVKDLNSFKAEFFLNPDWMNLVLADRFHIDRVFLVLVAFRDLLAIFKLYQADKLVRFSSNIINLIYKFLYEEYGGTF